MIVLIIASSLASLALVLALLYLLILVRPRKKIRPRDALLCDYAHRGLHGNGIPENSLAAFEKACEAGYGIELDVHLSSDGEVMVFHDDNLKRVCGIDKNISDLTCAQLKAIRLGNSSQTIPTLDEVLSLVRGRVTLLIEIKSTGKNDALCREVAKKLDSYSGAFAVQSFSPLIIRWFMQYRPTYARGQLVTRLTKKNQPTMKPLLRFALSNILLNVITRPDFISIDFSHRKNLSFILCTKVFGIKGFVWTIRSGEHYAAVHKEGNHAIFERFIPKK